MPTKAKTSHCLENTMRKKLRFTKYKCYSHLSCCVSPSLGYPDVYQGHPWTERGSHYRPSLYVLFIQFKILPGRLVAPWPELVFQSHGRLRDTCMVSVIYIGMVYVFLLP